MRTVYAPLDIKISPNDDKNNGVLVRTIYPNYILLSIKIAGMALVTTLYVRQLLWPNAKIPDIKMD